jgi:hypothetical protein
MLAAMSYAGIAAVCLAALGAAACTVGNGVGAASGTLFVYSCSKSGDYCPSQGACGTAANPAPYDLKPSFFAGEPIDDLREYSAGSAIMSNRLIIRLQHSGKQIEVNDVLTFDVVSSYEVARCVRGRVDPATGLGDWDESNCFRASDTGPGRMRVQHDSPVHVSLTVNATCDSRFSKDTTVQRVASAVSGPVPSSYATSTAPAVLDGGWDSWVELQEFGSASQADRPAQARDPVSPKFHVEFGKRIYATSFALTLVDDVIVAAALDNLPRPNPEIGGTLGGDPTTGRFDFNLARGESSQFFP